ncbi:MAG TPA: indolepyruvate ferredoxin oxidoreductase family protein, partial [Sphingomonadales bacterium]
GVFGLWYAKGPGVDRSGDAIKHANLAGVSPTGGVLLVFGDDHAGKSSTTAHQSDITLASWEVPVLYPSTLSEVLEYGLAGFAMSRFSGALVALKLVNETAESTAVVDFDRLPRFVIPEMPGDVHIRPDILGIQERDIQLVREKLPRAQTFARANRLDRIVHGADSPRFLIATAGKAHADTMAALALLGLDDAAARRTGVGVYKIGLLYPLDGVALAAAAAAAQEVFFVEEKRGHAEGQAKALLYNHPRRPLVTGKTGPDGAPLLPADLSLDVSMVAEHLAARLRQALPDIETLVPEFARACRDLGLRQGLRSRKTPPPAIRRPGFCAGCPHNSSTKVPDGSFGATGIGCHSMAAFHADRRPLPMGQMGGEGVTWAGQAPFTEEKHVFQNLGDGTYFHSGSLAIRQSIAAGVNITYKILCNDAVAMTGGQPVEGGLTVGRIVRQVLAEGVARVVVVSDDPDRFGPTDPLPPGTELRHRDQLAAVQEELRRHPGVTVLIYDQVCAAEKRRRRKTNDYPDPDRRIFINAAVCEGCGDCSVQSGCAAIQPLETELGRKRRIDQSACNKDFSCLKGFCPSFVVVEGARRRKRAASVHGDGGSIPLPVLPEFGDGFDMIV